MSSSCGRSYMESSYDGAAQCSQGATGFVEELVTCRAPLAGLPVLFMGHELSCCAGRAMRLLQARLWQQG